MAVAEDLGPGAVDADERIVLGHAAVRIQPDHRAVMVGEILGALALPALTHGDKQMALRVEREPRAEVIGRVHQRLGREDHLEVLQPAVAENGPRDAGAVAAIALGRIGQVDQPVRRELGIERDVEQPALAAGVNRRHALDRRGNQLPLAHDAQATGSLRDEDARVRQKRHAPRVLEPADHRDQLERRLLRGNGVLRRGIHPAAAAGPGHDHADRQGGEPPSKVPVRHLHLSDTVMSPWVMSWIARRPCPARARKAAGRLSKSLRAGTRCSGARDGRSTPRQRAEHAAQELPPDL